MLFDVDLETPPPLPANVLRRTWIRAEPFPMLVHLFGGSVCDATADAICTSTNGRLSLMGGSGGDALCRGGWTIRRACEAIMEQHRRATGEDELPPGTAWITVAGRLSAQALIHCVASNSAHASSVEIIRGCVRSALSAAAASFCRSVSMPVFATGHAAFRFDQALETIAAVLSHSEQPIEEVSIVVLRPDRIRIAESTLNPWFQT